MFFGRLNELKKLDNNFKSKKSELVVIYGRRRVGKSTLIRQFLKDKSSYFLFEGIEGNSSAKQMEYFKDKMAEFTKDSLLEDIKFSGWEKVFKYFTEKMVSRENKKEKMVVFFDEIQWMASGRKQLISIIKYFWDNHWKDQNVMLILCGSIASFMVDKVINSTALYGRVTEEMLIKGLNPDEIASFFKGKRDKTEILNYQLIFGGVPKYFEEIDISASFYKNINRLCFSPNSLMLNEVDKIFYKQYAKAETYLDVVNLLKNGVFSFKEIAEKIAKKSGGSLKKVLSQLEKAELVESFVPFEQGWNTKFRKYRLSDEFLRFYFKYMEPNMTAIQNQKNTTSLFEKISADSLDIWLGFAFERFCLKHSWYLAEKMGFANETIYASPYFQRNDSGFQIDLLYKRVDNVIVVCEIKYNNDLVSASVIKEVSRKIELLKPPKGYSVEKALISLHGPDKSLKESEYFDHYLTIEMIIG
ncbi:MAG TPA: ATP-binding protein [bacterium]|nr:ATP-binding protein [bacterium]HPS31447.1 ATP-binding protein [bacterium]